MFQRFVLAFSLSLMTSTALAADGPLQIYVSKADQTLTVYDGDVVVATSKVSTGKPGHTTPSGIFSILEKRKYHESNLYSNAPMPFMQRLTWSGIALHEGKVPNHPASHGCVRLPNGFAKTLFQMTERGAHVIITDDPLAPRPMTHANLFTPRLPVDDGGLLSDVELRPGRVEAALKPVEVAMNSVPPRSGAEAKLVIEEPPPLRILITRRTQRDVAMDVQRLLNQLGFDAGVPDGLLGTRTIAAIKDFKEKHAVAKDGEILSKPFLAALYTEAGEDHPPMGQLMIRQKFQPLFSAAIDIKEPGKALGTHFLEATAVDRFKRKADWRGVTLDDHLAASTQKRLGITEPADDPAIFTAEAALSRIVIPDELRARIETMLSEGSSITIQDTGLGPETGDGTDFITVTRSKPRV
ncbi:peptidoglycan hydrolase-like protein with peptidoglycan-binding domain [Peteryoungia aggregata LMG 23059]|uniref:Peptidoglycan hydrolase-like protein with peptidoglycan-binding domain n=1 Tax=Peteryoungia aggregata LMG 23059 TaxID=1368425 RepID=A0ABU0G9N4_9HYPH|nr:L,D-transpeptidase family protein [Peteryoungia aggregata]MDQ0421629.1 peptidoglycan hydrolase-like protein with peptidoglycan-binding domain [Peteryoungia aggregata LMG 23059]